jgi:hypothetical protein
MKDREKLGGRQSNAQPGREYRVAVKGELPADLVKRVSAMHAKAILAHRLKLGTKVPLTDR